jgi:DNA (cytosine-5)-methyltransferase 1
MAFETLRHNLIDGHNHYTWPSWLPIQNHDIKSVLKKYASHLAKLKGSVDLVAGGPPCQGFSMDGRRDEGDKRNKLIHSYIEFIRIVRPKILFFENVKGFTIPFKRGKQGGTAYSDRVVKKLESLGYDVCGNILDFSDFGIPQRRKRFIIVGVRRRKSKGTLKKNTNPKVFFELLKNKKNAFLKSCGLTCNTSVKEAISDLEKRHGTVQCPESKRFDSGLYGKPRTPYQILLRAGDNETSPNCHRFANHLKETIKVFDKLLRYGRKNRKINGQERKKYGLKKRSVTVMSPIALAPTLTSIPDDYLHYSEPRILTVRESARLQTFPDWFEFKGKYTTGGHLRSKQVPRYTQVGNAIPPLFSEQAGVALKHL